MCKSREQQRAHGSKIERCARACGREMVQPQLASAGSRGKPDERTAAEKRDQRVAEVRRPGGAAAQRAQQIVERAEDAPAGEGPERGAQLARNRDLQGLT